MKKIMRLTCLALFCVGAVWVEYEMALHFVSALILFLMASFLAALVAALFCAPEGYERAGRFHVRAPARRSDFVRRVRLFQRQVRREWT